MGTSASPTIHNFTCSVVICTRDRPADLDRCLAAVSQLVYPRFDVIVVDNAPSDGRTSDIAQRHGAHYILEPAPGLSRARNRGARSSTSDIVAFLDDDAIPDSGWLAALAAEFHDPAVMAVTGRIVRPPKVAVSDESAMLSDHIELGLERRVFNRQQPFWFEAANFGGIGIGANMAFRRSAFDEWPGFDRRLGRGAPLCGAEENFAFFCLLEKHGGIVYTPDAIVHHGRRLDAKAFEARYLENAATFAGLLTLLLVETRYRWRLLKFLFGALTGKRRSWRAEAMPRHHALVPRGRILLACLRGPWLYAKAWGGSKGISGGAEGSDSNQKTAVP
jgi:glycosyltransferase involved in cell wall biosynthesis